MLALNLKPVFKARSIERPYTFLVKAGFPAHTATLLLNGKRATFRLAHIERLCEILNCTPNELLVWTPKKDVKLADSHPLTRLRKQNIDNNWQDTLKTMPLDQLNEIAAIISKHKKT